MLKYSQIPGLLKCEAFNGAQHIFSPAKLVQNIISRSVHHFGTTAGIISVLTSFHCLQLERVFTCLPHLAGISQGPR